MWSYAHLKDFLESIWDCRCVLNTGVNIHITLFVFPQVIRYKENSLQVFSNKASTFSSFTTPSLTTSLKRSNLWRQFKYKILKGSKNIYICIYILHIKISIPLHNSSVPFEVKEHQPLFVWVLLLAIVSELWGSSCITLDSRNSFQMSCYFSFSPKNLNCNPDPIRCRYVCLPAPSISGQLPKQQQISALCRLQYCYAVSVSLPKRLLLWHVYTPHAVLFKLFISSMYWKSTSKHGFKPYRMFRLFICL